MAKAFYGWRVVAAVFVLATFGWGFGFYGPPVFLHAVREMHGWPLAVVSAAVTAHFLFGAVVVALLPLAYRRFGAATVTKAGCLSLAIGVVAWAFAREPWHLFAAAVASGAGWATMGAASVNAIVSAWFVRKRPAALAAAYNGASIGGVVFAPLWVAAITYLGFAGAAVALGIVMVVAVWMLASLYFARTPDEMGLAVDGDASVPVSPPLAGNPGQPRSGQALWRDVRFVTLAGGMALGLFAQIGLLAHLFSLLVPALGAQAAGFAAGAATAAAIVGRTLFGWLMPVEGDRRLVACASYVVQIAGSLAFLLAGGESVGLLLLGVVLFGFGIGNATSLPPTIAQVEFAKEDVARVVPLIVAVSQATYAFAPAAFGMLGEIVPKAASPGAAPWLFLAAAIIQAAAIVAFLLGRRGRLENSTSRAT